jgi:hypothetical protein
MGEKKGLRECAKNRYNEKKRNNVINLKPHLFYLSTLPTLTQLFL